MVFCGGYVTTFLSSDQPDVKVMESEESCIAPVSSGVSWMQISMVVQFVMGTICVVTEAGN